MECNYLVVTESSPAASVLEFSTVHEAWFSQKARSEADSQVVPKAVWPLDRAVCGSIVNNRAKCVSASTRPVISERYKCAQTCQHCARGKPLFTPCMATIFFFMLLPQALTSPSLQFVACGEVVEKWGCRGNGSFLDSELLRFCSFPERAKT